MATEKNTTDKAPAPPAPPAEEKAPEQTAPPAPPAPAAEEPKAVRGCFVADGVSVTTKQGLKEPGEEITAKILGGGTAALKQLIKAKKVVDRR